MALNTTWPVPFLSSNYAQIQWNLNLVYYLVQEENYLKVGTSVDCDFCSLYFILDLILTVLQNRLFRSSSLQMEMAAASISPLLRSAGIRSSLSLLHSAEKAKGEEERGMEQQSGPLSLFLPSLHMGVGVVCGRVREDH